MFTIIYTAIITFVIMVLLHHLYTYLKTNLTIPKVNDVITVQTMKYDEIKKSLGMKEELKDYLKHFKQT